MTLTIRKFEHDCANRKLIHKHWHWRWVHQKDIPFYLEKSTTMKQSLINN